MDRYAAAAREALNFIEAQRDGAIWRWHDDPKARANHSLYNGAGGVALLLLELHAGSPDPDGRALGCARRGEHVHGHRLGVGPSRGETPQGRDGITVALAHGLPQRVAGPGAQLFRPGHG